jgi:stage III sporulation protein AG
MSPKKTMNEFINFDKLLNNRKFLYAVIVISALIVMFSFTFNNEDTENISESTSLSVYKNELTKELCNILSKVDGVGKVNALITFDTNTDQEVVYNTKETTSTNSQNSSNSSISKDVVMMKDGSVNVPYILENEIPNIKGVLIVAEGAENEDVENRIKDAVVTVLKIPAYRAVVLPMG